MIIEGLLNVIKSLLTLLLSPIDIPSLPNDVPIIIQTALGYITDGLGLAAYLTHWSYIRTLVIASLAIEGAMLLYKFILWILKKIPMAAVE